MWGIGLIRLRIGIIGEHFVNAALNLRVPKAMELVNIAENNADLPPWIYRPMIVHLFSDKWT